MTGYFEDRCEIHCINEDKVNTVKEKMLSLNEVQMLGELFKTMGDPTRLRLIYALMNAELCVCDLSAVIGVSESAVSHQLRILRHQQLVKYRRHGKMLYYSLKDDHIATLIIQGIDHVRE